MSKPLSFQQIILRLQQFWADHGCLIWQPYAEKVGAGTSNPATVLRVLGPEPWNVAYVEPSYRPADGRYGENPNRMQYFYQYQVILKPDPGDPQERYLESLLALGIQREEHDIRFVEDNWESPAFGAWGLGWEVWLDGLEITQFTYFQQAGGFVLEPISVEITYGLERIAMFLQSVRSVWEIDWDGRLTYGDVLLQPEIENCRYGFELADVDALRRMYDLFESEALRCLDAGLVIPAHDYVLRCSHAFNLLDARGAVGVTERASFFRRMRNLARRAAEAFAEQRQRMEYPWLGSGGAKPGVLDTTILPRPTLAPGSVPATCLLEVGTEELPTEELDVALRQLQERVATSLTDARLEYESLRVLGTPRRLVVLIEGLAVRQKAVEETVKGPPASAAFDADGNPTKAAEGFARKHGVSVAALGTLETEEGAYVFVTRQKEGRPAVEVMRELLPEFVAGLRFSRSMRWNATGFAFPRPIRWLVALLGRTILHFEVAGVHSGRTSRGPRPEGSPPFDISDAAYYLDVMRDHHVVVDPEERRAAVASQVAELAASVGGRVADDPALLSEVANLVEQPTAFLGQFEEEYLTLPEEVLVAVMKKHQRYFPVLDADSGRLSSYFVVVRNGGTDHLDIVREGNEQVIRARFADARFFYKEDTKRALQDFVPRLDTLVFQEQLGSVLDKTQRVERLVPELAGRLGLDSGEVEVAARAAQLCKADLATQMVVEITSLQGVIGSEYALKAGEPSEVAQAIAEHYLPRFSGDVSPETRPGLVLGLADRLDSLAGLFAVGLAPTGSSDPYGLRRDALGLAHNLIAARQSFSVREGLELAAALLPVPAAPEILGAALDFVVGRLRVYFREQGFRYDVVEAILAARGDDPYRAWDAVEQLARQVEREDWPRVLDNYARCVRITRKFTERFPLKAKRLVEPAEEKLYAAYQTARDAIAPSSSVDAFFAAFDALVDVIDDFFAKESGVLVMAEDRKLQENRLALLQHIAGLAEGIADLSQLEGF